MTFDSGSTRDSNYKNDMNMLNSCLSGLNSKKVIITDMNWALFYTHEFTFHCSIYHVDISLLPEIGDSLIIE
ncbi:hypothetical protein WKT22_02438 [Candidatus Lokiarchaeum ossiferum]